MNVPLMKVYNYTHISIVLTLSELVLIGFETNLQSPCER
jgi:hypothetical protein